ncbi:methyltransferase domain-containing protein [Streptomyces sp. NBRC 109706]|uniref:methyltransferase domain-containing protein n=1 Tax=Streptomyces sp. NBRC 109706 TaxID=1550035 RepID=UPI00099BC1D3|nr:methyltransferase domain-containing protein [Streptomyces sp. NBRC 109706]
MSAHETTVVPEETGDEQAEPAGPAERAGNATVGDDIVTTNTRWSFAGSTPRHFDAHVNKSVPLYLHGHELIAKCVEFFSRPGGTIIDVGCSTGTLLASIARKPSSKDLSLVGIDIEADMVRAARETCARLENVTISQGEVLSADYTDSNAVIMYYTLQFAPPEQRRLALERIYDGLVEGGGLFLFEKVLSPDARLQDMLQQLYLEFKIDNGFEPEEIYNKERSLRSVMAPQPSNDTHELLHRTGFTGVVTIQKYLFFEGILAIK